jgi:hypothetical protein
MVTATLIWRKTKIRAKERTSSSYSSRTHSWLTGSEGNVAVNFLPPDYSKNNNVLLLCRVMQQPAGALRRESF